MTASIDLGDRVVPYRVVRTPRARVIRIRVGDRGVVVSAPSGTRDSRITAALRANRDWLVDALARVTPPPTPLAVRPGMWVPYLDDWRRVGSDIPLGPRADVDTSLEAWYRTAAHRHLGDLVWEWAPRIGVKPARLAVRGQRTRWGSASARGTISLNWRLMLAPARVGEYVVVHELAHLVHMDHSPRFWDVVTRHWPDHRADRAWLRTHGAALQAGPAGLAVDERPVT